jgi:hypothetical protein
MTCLFSYWINNTIGNKEDIEDWKSMIGFSESDLCQTHQLRDINLMH